MERFEYVARFDGGCWPNPGGHASCACVIARGAEEAHRECVYLGSGSAQTNNVAEFSGLLLILKWLKANAPQAETQIISDSTIVVNRMNSRNLPKGVCRVKAQECLSLLAFLPRLSFIWQPREENADCDRMCMEVLRQRGAPVGQIRTVAPPWVPSAVSPVSYWKLEERVARLEAELRMRIA